MLDEETQLPLGAQIEVKDLSTGKLLGESISDPQTGYYTLILPYGTAYSFHATARNHAPIRQSLNLREASETILKIKQDLSLVPLKTGATIRLNNVFFKRGSAELLTPSYQELASLVELMQEYPKMKIVLTGHTDDHGDKDRLVLLSKARAKTVKAYLIDQRISTDRIVEKGVGGTEPAFSE